MGRLRYTVCLSAFVLAVVLNTHAAPTDFPTRTFEGDTNVNPTGVNEIPGDRKTYRSKPKEPEVRTDERYHKTYDDGTVEFKTALSNGHIQYQRISNKDVDGTTVQVFEGYTSVPYADGRYGTTYYIADENGYRQTKVEVSNKPPVLPKSGPIAEDIYNSNDRGHELDFEHSTFEKNNNERVSNGQAGFENKPKEGQSTGDDNVTNGIIEEIVAIVSELPPTEVNLLTSSVLPNTEEKKSEFVPALDESIGRTSSVLINSDASTQDPQLTESNVDYFPVLPISEEKQNTDGHSAEENEINNESKNEGAQENSNDLSVLPIAKEPESLPNTEVTEANDDSSSVVPITEEIKTIADGLNVSTEQPTLQGIDNSQQDSSENEVNDEKSTEAPVIVAVQENKESTDDNKDATEPSSYSTTDSILTNDVEDNISGSTVLPTLQDDEDVTTEEVVTKVAEVNVESSPSPVTEEVAPKIEETDVTTETAETKGEDDSDIDGSGELPTTQDSITHETSTLSQNGLSNEQTESSSTEVSEEQTREGSTELPVDEAKVHGDSTDLPIIKTDEEKVLEASTEGPVFPEISTENDKLELIQTEASTELPSSSSDEEKIPEVSTEVQESSATDKISTVSSNDEVTINDGTTVNEENHHEPSNEEGVDAITKIDDTSLEASIDDSSDDVIKNEGSTDLPSVTDDEKELHDMSTKIPEVPVTEEIPSKPEVNEIEASTEIPSSSDISVDEENNHESSTEIPTLQVTEDKTSEDNVVINEATSELPTLDDKTLEASTEVPAPEVPSDVQVEELPGLDVTVQDANVNASSELPALTDTNEEIKSTNNEDTLNGSNTELPVLDETHSLENKTDGTSTEVPALTVTDEISIKSAEDNLIQTEASTELPAENENIDLATELSDGSNVDTTNIESGTEKTFLTNLLHTMKHF